MNEDNEIIEILRNTHSIAVIGMKENDAEISYRVPEYLSSEGYEIFPVNPAKIGKEALGKKFYARVSDIDEKIDLVEIFRRPEFLETHVEEILAMKTRPVYAWFQSGIVNDNAAKTLEEAGIKVIQDRCMFIEHRRLKNKIQGKT